MLSNRNSALIILVSIGAGMIALEDRAPEEITPSEAVFVTLVDAAAERCMTDYQSYAARRMTMMAFGISAPARNPDDREAVGGGPSCEDR